MNPGTGKSKLGLSGIDWRHFQYDHVKQGKRRVGSTLKPFCVCYANMNLGMTPCLLLPYPKGSWSVKGWGGCLALRERRRGAVPVMDMAGSDNVIKTSRV